MRFKICYDGNSKVIRKLCELVNQKASLGTSHDEAFFGDQGLEAYEHSQLTSGNPHNVTAKDLGLENVLARLDAIQFAIGMVRSWVTHKNEQVVTHKGDFLVFHGVNAENYNYLTWH